MSDVEDEAAEGKRGNGKPFCVITTIREPTTSVIRLALRLEEAGGTLIVAGDGKGPLTFPLEGAKFLSLAAQIESGFELARQLPVGHYSRKNVGYLRAIEDRASSIYETDDDNAPLDHWQVREEVVDASTSQQSGWNNVFRCFTRGRIWPRGFPLDEVANGVEGELQLAPPAPVRAPIQQGLVNGCPDVDAVWRLVLGGPFRFEPGPSVRLKRSAWCPFNSQSTWWFPIAYPLMYLPSYCSFRMTDIWRSFIAQRCLWELGLGVVFHGPEVVQERNAHDLMRDFADEIPGYTRNKTMVDVLEGLSLSEDAQSIGGNLLLCYEALVAEGFFRGEELELVRRWLDDLERIRRARGDAGVL